MLTAHLDGWSATQAVNYLRVHDQQGNADGPGLVYAPQGGDGGGPSASRASSACGSQPPVTGGRYAYGASPGC